MMKNRLIGMRTIKTALVVIISYIVSSLINEELSFALIYAAVICVETSVVSSVKIGYNRVLGTVIGGVIGLIMNYVPLYGGITMAIGIIITIMFTNLLNIKKATGIAITLVVIIIIGSSDTSPAIYAMQRTLDTIIGIVIATLVNMMIYPPDQMRMVRESFEHYKHTAKEIVSEVLLYDIDNGLATLTKELDDFREKYDSLSKELKILKKYDMEDYEYYTQMIEASEKVLIYTEAISLSDPDVKMTADNNQKLTKILAQDMKQTEFVDLDSSTREDMIFNYNLAKLISALEKILRVRVVRTDQN
ncbi:aromatic acid exporter family protein [Proteiniclasticum sp. SCR006]|uniref:Aromatic acid exporter family protein n=1 Tax=Proteiniclasticum aestuarii TaxID=2817862 RepID=A0A939H9Q6_9CLOT|nr:aromatic acid exporter family protein [Proteiniclasticum aestuarii]MBO1265761.1 aromatic acid exporter family protein [Proteiniclasticum aestuarii]